MSDSVSQNKVSAMAPENRQSGTKMSPQKRKRFALWFLFTILALSVVMPLGSYGVHWLSSSAIAQEAKGESSPRGDFWRAVGAGTGGYSSVKGEGANMLVQRGGNEWRELRNGPLKKYLPYVLGAMVLLIVLYHLIRGRNKLEHPRSGRKVKRWNGFERFVHWVTAISFIILAVSGLSMMFGRGLLIPLLGHEGFALWASLSITLHNFVGPVFSVGVLLMIVMWIWHNFPNKTDLKWFASGGGLIGSAHPSAGRMNGGEKLWFWVIATVGVVVCLSGLILVAPIFGFEIPIAMEMRALMQQASLIHLAAAVIWTAVAIGHIYIGTAGTEGAFEGMATGYVSEEWAKQHHDLWYDEVARKSSASGYASRAELEVMRRENERLASSGAGAS